MNQAAWLTQGRLRARRDLRLTASGDATVVKDPLSLEYFRLDDRERFLLDTLREPMSIVELTRRFQRRFPNERATGAQVLGFCASLYDCSLLQSDQPHDPTSDRRHAAGKGPWYTPLLSPLAIRLPGVDPTPLLNRLNWLGRWVFSPTFVALLTISAVMVAIGLLGRVDEVAAGMGRMLDLFNPANAGMAVAALVITKSWHELGHAVACRRMGAECHEIGVLLLALLPCLYCDASDAWTLPSRWRRAVVALAGVYFETMLAVAAAAAWLVLAPGPLKTLSLYVVGMASVSTVLVNLNPLLRYDGYYLLADAWGVANLHQQSREALWGRLKRWVRCDPTPSEPLDAPTWLLGVYGLASTAYGWAILALFLWASHKALSSAGFAAVGDLLVAVSLGGMAVVGLRSASGFAPRGPGGRSLASLLRFALMATVAVAIVVGVASIPREQSLRSACRLESQVMADVVARSSGVLRPSVRYGDHVKAGQLLAELDDAADQLLRLELLEREAALVAEIEGLRTRSQRDPQLLAEIARLRPTLSEVRRQLNAHDQQTERRRLRATIAGRVDPPSERTEESAEETPSGDLPTWSGAPLEPVNDGCWLESGEPLCRLTGAGVRVVVLLGEDDSGLVRVGNRVRIALDRSVDETLFGRVESVAPAAADERLSDAERRVEESLRDPLQAGATYRASVVLDDAPPVEAQPGAVGQARIVTGEETVGGWALRWLRRLVRFG